MGRATRAWMRHLEDTPLIRDLVARGQEPSAYQRWIDQVARTGYCSRPIRLAGEVCEHDPSSGQSRTVYSTSDEPDGILLVACRNRRDSRCPSCSWTYRGDAFQLVTAGLRGGKGVPDTVIEHPMLFVTLTAPSFGSVHSRRERKGKAQLCHPIRRPRPQVCRHGVKLTCSRKHGQGDELLGQPLCPDCFDYEGAVLWNALASQLWKRTPTRILRELAQLTGHSVRGLDHRIRVSFIKVAETQTRGVIHLHAIVRLDARPPKTRPDLVLSPPGEFTAELVAEAVGAAVRHVRAKAPAGPDGQVFVARWGEQLDMRFIRLDAGAELTAEAVAAYIAKYATKEPEAFAALNRRIACEGDIQVLALNDHIRRLVATAWRLGAERHLVELNLRLWAHQLGFRGHWLTKSHRYSTTFAALREVRAKYRRDQERQHPEPVDTWGRPLMEHATERVASWRFCGAGYRTHADAWLADTARQRTQEGRRVLREERARARREGGY